MNRAMEFPLWVQTRRSTDKTPIFLFGYAVAKGCFLRCVRVAYGPVGRKTRKGRRSILSLRELSVARNNSKIGSRKSAKCDAFPPFSALAPHSGASPGLAGMR